MNSARVLFYMTVATTTTAIYTYEPKIHEQWWQANCNSKIHLFREWYGSAETKERTLLCNYLKEKQYESILDAGCSLCTLFFAIKKEQLDIDYQGLDVTQSFVERAQKFGITTTQASVEHMPFDDNTYDIVYARHVLEHLEYYQQALNEMIRVAKKEVMISFFMHPNNWTPDAITINTIDELPVYHNQYNKLKLESWIKDNPKVESVSWRYVGSDYSAHIMLKA